MPTRRRASGILLLTGMGVPKPRTLNFFLSSEPTKAQLANASQPKRDLRCGVWREGRALLVPTRFLHSQHNKKYRNCQHQDNPKVHPRNFNPAQTVNHIGTSMRYLNLSKTLAIPGQLSVANTICHMIAQVSGHDLAPSEVRQRDTNQGAGLSIVYLGRETIDRTTAKVTMAKLAAMHFRNRRPRRMAW